MAVKKVTRKKRLIGPQPEPEGGTLLTGPENQAEIEAWFNKLYGLLCERYGLIDVPELERARQVIVSLAKELGLVSRNGHGRPKKTDLPAMRKARAKLLETIESRPKGSTASRLNALLRPAGQKTLPEELRNLKLKSLRNAYNKAIAERTEEYVRARVGVVPLWFVVQHQSPQPDIYPKQGSTSDLTGTLEPKQEAEGKKIDQ